MDFRPLGTIDRQALMNALRGNAAGECSIQMSAKDTTFLRAGSIEATETTERSERQVIDSIKSVPCHYADSRCCELCDEWIGNVPKAVLAKTNKEIYGSPIGASCCSSCVQNFVENEKADGARA